VSLFGNDGFAGTTGSSLTMWVTSCAIRLLMKRTKKCKGGLKLDYEILKSLKFTSQFKRRIYTWKNYNFEDTRNIWLQQILAEMYLNTTLLPMLIYTKGRNQYQVYQVTSMTLCIGIHELTGGIETSIRREQLTISRKMLLE
jgi:hypothetical protein